MSEQIEKMFEKLISNLGIDPTVHLSSSDADISKEHEKVIQDATQILEGNISDEIEKFVGNLNEDEFKKAEDEIKKRFENPVFKPFLKDLEKVIKKWQELKKEQINNLLILTIPVKEMPFPSITFILYPRIVWEKNKLDKMSLNKDTVVYAGEIKALVTRTVLYGKIPKEDPLFAPHIGQLDLAGYKPDPSSGIKTHDFRFIFEIIQSLERTSTQSQVVRYHAQYERHGEPICDYLMNEVDLVKSMGKLASALESKRQSSNASVAGIVLPMIDSSFIMCLDESNSSKKYEICFEALLKLGAASYASPKVKKGSELSNVSSTSIPVQSGQSTQPQLPVWTAEDLAEEAKKRGTAAPNLPTWSEEELAEDAKKRGNLTNLPMWTEEDLESEQQKRQGRINVPEWEEDPSLIDCPKCGYSCNLSWGDCPSCGTTLKTDVSQKIPDEGTETEPQEKSKAEQHEESKAEQQEESTSEKSKDEE